MVNVDPRGTCQRKATTLAVVSMAAGSLKSTFDFLGAVGLLSSGSRDTCTRVHVHTMLQMLTKVANAKALSVKYQTCFGYSYYGEVTVRCEIV